MHSVTESATPGDARLARHQETVRRIVAAARRLTVERGIDGFTMDDLAEAVGVSRRTLFNHVAGKDEAVLGTLPELPADAVADFVAGLPHGDLVADITALAVRVIELRPESPEEVALERDALHANPRLRVLSQQRLHDLVESSIELVEQREGAAYDRDRLDVAVAVVLACCELAMTRYLHDDAASTDGADLGRHLLEVVATARTLLA